MSPGRTPWRPGIFLAYALLIIGSSWAYGLWHIRNDRAATLAASENELLSYATAVGAQVEAMLGDGIGAAAAAANLVRSSEAEGARFDRAARERVLRQMTTGGSYVRALFLIGDGVLAVAPAGSHPGPAEASVQRWVSALARRTDGTWIGPPETREADGSSQVAIARRVEDIGGTPVWAGAVIGWENIERNYELLAAARSSLALVSEDGFVLARLPTVPGRDLVGANIADSDVARQFRALPPQSLVAMVAPDTLSGEPRQYAVRRVESVPLVAVAGRAVDDALAAWAQRRSASLQLLTVASLTVLALTFALNRALTRRFEALRRSEERFELAIAGTNDGIWEWERDTGRLFYSPRLLQLLQLSSRDRVLSQLASLRSLVHPEDRTHAEAALRAHLWRREPLDVELRVFVRDAWRWFRARGQAVWDEAGQPLRMAGAMGDIHESRLAAQAAEQARQAELAAKQEFARELILAQEQERKRLANELHDSVGQNLSLIRNRSLLLQRMELPLPARRQAESLHSLATDAIEEVRAVAQNLRPLHIEEMGVTDAIEALVQRVANASPLQVTSRIENVDDVLQGSAATHLFRIVQEAVNNVLKHADARRLEVVIERDLAHVRLVIRDDGRGFEREGVRRGGLGLLSIEERSGILGGRIAIDSAPGRGTCVQVDIPVIDDPGGDREEVESA